MTDTTTDSLYHGELVLEQPRRGYRFSVDAPLLAAFAAYRKSRRIADLGAGCGVVGLSLLHLGACREAVLVEIQPGLADLAIKNIERNGFSDRAVVRTCDARRWQPIDAEKGFDLVVANPPYHPVDRGKRPEDEERRVARTEISMDIQSTALTASRILKPKGRLSVIYPAGRVEALFRAINDAGLAMRRLCFCHPRSDSPAEIVLAEAQLAKKGKVQVGPPWVLHDIDGNNSVLLEAILSGRVPDRPCSE